jgi:hypothetical protein
VSELSLCVRKYPYQEGAIMADLSIRVFKSWNVVDEVNAWVNNYEIIDGFGDLDPAGTEARDLLNAIIAAERLIHLTGVQFFKATISTWVNDSAVYNPTSFVSVPLDVTGQRAAAGDALDANVAYFVKKEVASGRSGKIFYRGCLTEADVQPRGDLSFALTATSTLATGGTAFSAYEQAMQPVMNSGFAGGYLGLIGQVKGLSGNPGPVYKREVVDLTPAGVVVNRRNHKWFNRIAS